MKLKLEENREFLGEMRKEDNLYLVGPFWLIAKSLEDLNEGNFEIISRKFLIDYEGNYQNRVPKSQFTHKGIWENEIKRQEAFDYLPRGRVSRNHGDTTVNIPAGLNEKVVIERLAKEYDFDTTTANVKYTDPTSGNHYTFNLK